MRVLFYFGAVAVAACALTACGSGPSANTTTTGAVPATGTNATAPNVVATGPANSAPSGISVPAANAVPADANAAPAGPISMASKRGITDGPAPNVTPVPKLLPDSSQVTTTMGKDGSFIQTRAFPGNPYLSKVVSSTNGANGKVQIYLVNGKVVSVSQEKVPVVTAPTVQQFLDMAGFKPPETASNRKKGDPAN